MAPRASTAGVMQITLEPLDYRVVEVAITGRTELITHRWPEKAKQLMRDKQQGRTMTKKREAKNPAEDYEAAFHRLPDGRPGVPAVAFKAAMVDACRFFSGLSMTAARLLFQVLGEGPDQLVPIIGEAHMREDMVRNETGVADIRYRPGFPEWRATLRVRYNASMLTPDAIVMLVNGAGECGVGEWRPNSKESKTGWAGTFGVATGG